MPTTTVIFKFTPESSQEVLDARATAYMSKQSPVLNEFANIHNTSVDNLVSETVNNSTCLRTVVRSWPTVEVATAWVNLSLGSNSRLTDDYPGIVISAQVDSI